MIIDRNLSQYVIHIDSPVSDALKKVAKHSLMLSPT